MISKRTNDLSSVDFLNGEVLLINKHLNCTSAQLVYKVKRLFNINKIGHAGTLDPKATGLMILCTGKATKRINTFQNLTKEYRGKIFFGKTTPSMDTETLPENEKSIEYLTLSKVEEKAKLFIGETDQIPPLYSAIWVNGKRAYKLARKGRSVELKSRKVLIDKFEVFDFNPPVVSFLVSCSKGTYIRKLAFDLGEALGCGGFLYELERTKIGEYDIAESLTLDELKAFANKDLN